MVKEGLQDSLGKLPNDIPPDNTARGTVYGSQNVDFVFLYPIKVNSPSDTTTALWDRR
jgi:hypothetical protein